MELHKIEQLTTDRLILRPFKIIDAQDVFEWAGDIENTKFLSFVRHKNVIESRQTIETILSLNTLAIVLKDSGKCIGSFGLILDDDITQGEFGYCLNKKYWRQGYMSEVLHTLIPYIFTHSSITQLTAAVKAENIASAKLLESSGFALKTELSKFLEIKGELWDIKLYQKHKKSM